MVYLLIQICLDYTISKYTGIHIPFLLEILANISLELNSWSSQDQAASELFNDMDWLQEQINYS